MKPALQPRCESCGHKLKHPRKASAKAKATRARVRARSLAKSEKHRMSTREIRSACVKRAGGFCECGCGRWLTNWGETMDHWLSGSGRKRERQAVETCWMLTLKCHAARQANSPSAETWNDRRRHHCTRYGYHFVGHVEHAAVPRRSANV